MSIYIFRLHVAKDTDGVDRGGHQGARGGSQGRLVERPGVRAERLRRVDPHLRREAVPSARVDRRASDVVEDDEPAVRLEPRRDCHSTSRSSKMSMSSSTMTTRFIEV